MSYPGFGEGQELFITEQRGESPARLKPYRPHPFHDAQIRECLRHRDEHLSLSAANEYFRDLLISYEAA